MNIKLFGDIHVASGVARRIQGIAGTDPVVGNVGLTSCGGVRQVKTVLAHILALNPTAPAQSGDMDRPEAVNDYLEQEARGRDCLAGTPLVTPGALRGGGWATISINNSHLEIHRQ